MWRNKDGFSVVEVLLFLIVIGVFVIGGYLILNGGTDDANSDDTNSSSESADQSEDSNEEADGEEEQAIKDGVDYDELFQEVVDQLGIDTEVLTQFTFFGDDKVTYSDSPALAHAYNAGDGWQVAYRGQAMAVCSELSDVPDGYKPTCFDELTETTSDGDYSNSDEDYFEYITP